MKKRFLAILLTLAMMLSLLAFPVSADAGILASGSCGAGVTWTMTDDGTLTISGLGAMEDYSRMETPWYSYRDVMFTVIVEEGVTSIGDYAFAYLYNVESITIPSGVTSIGVHAFTCCYCLSSLTIPASVTSIGEDAFEYCDGLSAVTVGSGNAAYSSVDGVLFNYSRTELILYPAQKTDTSYTIPSGVTSIDDYAFYGCMSLTNITIPASVTSIEEYAFYGCYNLSAITVESGGTSYASADGVLFNYSMTELILYPTQKTDTSYTIPSSVTAIGDYAFADCYSLTSITIPSGVTTIGDYAFADCMSLTSITIPASVTSIGDYAFDYCYSLSAITVESGSTSFVSVDGVLFDYSMTELILYPTQKTDTSYTIPSGVKSIGSGAFTYCSLESITIPNSVTTIGDSAFLCTDLTSVELGDNVTYIGDCAFADCWDLTYVDLGDSVITIGDSAFDGCFELTEIELPDTLTSLGTRAFAQTGLTSIVVPASVETIGDGLFYYCTDLEYVIFEGSAPEVVEYEDFHPSEWADSKGYGTIFECDTVIVYYPDDGTWTSDVQHYYLYVGRDLYPVTTYYSYYDAEDEESSYIDTSVYVTYEYSETEDFEYTDVTWVSYDTEDYDSLIVFLGSEHFTDDYGTGTGSWSWASTYIYACYDAGIITGYTDGDSYSFLPANNLTRAEAATIIARAYGLTAEDDAASAFSDVSSSYWASTYIEACVEAGIINGYEDGTFRPTQNVTRVELAKMIAVAEQLALDAAESSFSDVSSDHWGLQYIEACVEAGIVNGYTDGTFLPANNVTRAEAAAMIARALGLAE